MPFVLQAGWTGRRVSVRRVVERAPDGRLLQGDVVGELVGLDAQTAVIEGPDGLVEVPVALVTAARLVEASTREVLDLQDVAARGLRAEHTLELDGWLLRADAGRPRRANSALPHAQLRLPIDDALTRAREWYAALGKPLVIQVPYPARRLLDAALGERNWGYSAPSDVLVAGIDRLRRAGPGRDDSAAQVDAVPDPAWLHLAGADDAYTRLLTRHETIAFASVRSDSGDVLAVARGSVDAGWLGVSSVLVAPDARRRGLGVQVTAALARWADGHGARRAYLQVAQDNTGAQALYANLGLTVHHSYHYRREP